MSATYDNLTSVAVPKDTLKKLDNNIATLMSLASYWREEHRRLLQANNYLYIVLTLLLVLLIALIFWHFYPHSDRAEVVALNNISSSSTHQTDHQAAL